MKSEQLTIKDLNLKQLLELFEKQDKLIITELGDTWHPASGFVNEYFFKDIKTVANLLAMDYDFRGLVVFEAEVNNIKITFDSDSDEFNISGDKNAIETLKQKMNIH